MKMLSNRTGGWIPALILAVLMVIGLSVSKVQAQNYNNGNGYYDDQNNGYYDDQYSDYGDYQEFYDDLSPYGQWLNDPQYGYVWTPSVGGGFRPYYTNGHWVMTEYGNMWVSDYSWGWAPFHYGRWAQSGIYGWIWIPGRTWGPAWVSWRQGGGYYGWAPMGPGISISFSFGSGYNAPNAWWTFIPCGNIYSRSYAPYYSPRRTVNIINNTTIINNTYVDARSRNTYVSGPRRNDVETATRQRVTVYNVNNQGRAGASQISGRNVNVYRPTVRTISDRSQAARPAPRQVKTLDRSTVTNAGGGRAPARTNSGVSRPATQPGRLETTSPRNSQVQQRNAQRDQQMQQSVRQQNAQRENLQRDQQIQQQQRQRDQQVQQQRIQQQQQQVQRQQQLQQQQAQRQQAEQQQRVQRQQQVQQQQQMQRQQMEQQQRVQQQQQMQQQRVQQQQMQQQQQQQRMQQQQQMQQQRQQQQQQQMQRQQQMQQRSAPQRVERSAPEAQPRSAPQPSSESMVR